MKKAIGLFYGIRGQRMSRMKVQKLGRATVADKLRKESGSSQLIWVWTCSTWKIGTHNEMQLKRVLRDLRGTVGKWSPGSTTYQNSQMIRGSPCSSIAQILVHRVHPLHNVVRVDLYVQLSGNPSNESWRELEDLVRPDSCFIAL
jgi:hypothetical protein